MRKILEKLRIRRKLNRNRKANVTAYVRPSWYYKSKPIIGKKFRIDRKFGFQMNIPDDATKKIIENAMKKAGLSLQEFEQLRKDRFWDYYNRFLINEISNWRRNQAKKLRKARGKKSVYQLTGKGKTKTV